jgi:hypothetical protein
LAQRTTTKTNVQSPRLIDVTSEDDEEGRATAVVSRDGRLESSRGTISSPNVKIRSRQEVDDSIDHMNVDGKPRLDDSAKALPTNFASTKRKSANFLDEILAEKANKKRRKKKKLKEDLNREAVA